MNYLSFSLWGNNPIYCVGALKNIELAKTLYNGWQPIIYYDDTVPSEIITKAQTLGSITIKIEDELYGMFWRFLAADIPDCKYVVFRDCDSRLSERERYAVDEWIVSGKSIHIMRDHPYHEIPFGTNSLSILGGMWGIKGNIVPMKNLIYEFIRDRTTEYGSDQTFLYQIYQTFLFDNFTHDDFFSMKKFPIRRIEYSFIGERIDENDNPIGSDRDILEKYYREKVPFYKIKKQIRIIIKKTLNLLLKKSVKD